MSLLDGRAIRDWCKTTFLKSDDMLRSKEMVESNTIEGMSVDALVIKEVFTSVSEGKNLIASAITDKGVQTDANAAFAVMAQNIDKIQGSTGSGGALKVQKVGISISASNTKKIIDIKNYSANYESLKIGENLFFVQTSLYFSKSHTVSSGWKAPSSYLHGNIYYTAATGEYIIYSAMNHGIDGNLYIVEIE